MLKLDREIKVLISNFISLSSLQLVSMILPLITLPYVLRVLGFENYGIVVLAISLINYFKSLTDYSFAYTATRDIAIFRNSKRKLNIIYTKVMMIKSFFLLLSFIIILLVVLSVPKFYLHKEIYAIVSLVLIGQVLFPDWFFQGIEKMKYITIINLFIKVFFTLSIFIFIKNEEDYWIYALLQSLGFVFSGILGQYVLVKRYGLRLVPIKIRYLKQSIVENFSIFINQFFPTLYNNTTILLLGLISGNTLVGIYDSIRKIIELLNVSIGIMSRVIFPYLSRKKDSFNIYKKYMTYIGLLFVLIPIVFNKIIFYYLNVSYEYSLTVLTILSIGVFGFTLNNIYGVNYFIIHRKDKVVMKNTIYSSIVGLILSFPLIYFFGIIGAAINLTFTRVLMGGSIYLKYLRK